MSLCRDIGMECGGGNHYEDISYMRKVGVPSSWFNNNYEKSMRKQI